MPNEFIVKNGLISQGNITVSGSITATGGVVVSGSIASASYAANADLLNGLNSTVFTLTSSFNAQTASFTAFTSSMNSFSASINTFSASILTNVTALNAKTASFATTGSNTFVGAEVISGSLAISGSGTPFTLNTDTLEITGSLLVTGSTTLTGSLLQLGNFTTTGTIIAQTINVQTVTSSIVYSSGSNVFGNDIGNSQRFTGSVLITGSLTIAGASSATSYNGATIFGSTIACSPIGCFATSCATSFIGGTMSGTTIYGSTAVCSANGLLIGNGGVTATCNYLPKFTGASTIGNSQIYDNGTNVGIGRTTPVWMLELYKDTASASTGVYPAISINNPNAGGYSGIYMYQGATQKGYFEFSNGSGAFNMNSPTTLNLQIATATKLSINSSGSVGIGTTTIGSTFQVNGNAAIGYSASTAAPTNGLKVAGVSVFDTNVGIGGTPSAWKSTDKVFQVNNSSLFDENGNNLWLGLNFYENTSSSYIYLVAGNATAYRQQTGQHQWFTSASGAAGGTVTFTNVMNLNQNGNLGIGTTTIGSKLQVNGNAAIGYSASTAAPTNGLQVAGVGVFDTNIGIGVTPPTTTLPIIISQYNFLSGTLATNISTNAYWNGGWKYYATNTAALYQIDIDGNHIFNNASSGTVNTAITFVESMRINNSRNVGIGTITIGSKLQVNGNAAIGYSASTAAPTNGLAVSGAVTIANSASATNALSVTGAATFSADLQVNGQIITYNSASGTDLKYWFLQNTTGGTFRLRAVNDVVTAGLNAIEISRTGISSVTTSFNGGSVGILTTTIGSSLQVNGNAAIGYSASTAAPTNGLAVSGQVGIGKTSTVQALDVVGNFFLRNTSGAGGTGYAIEFATDSLSPRVNFVVNGSYVGEFSSTATDVQFKNTLGGGGGGINFITFSNQTRAKITSGGNFLVGTTTDAGYMLDVNGTGNFTGALSGTSATFSGNVTVGQSVTPTLSIGNQTGDVSTNLRFVGNNTYRNHAIISNGSANGSLDFYRSTTNGGTTFTTPDLTIASTGAATFSSSVTATSFIPSYSTSYFSTDGTISNYSATNYMYVNGTGGLRLKAEGVGYQKIVLEGGTSNDIFFTTANVERFRIASTGAATFACSVTSVGLLFNTGNYLGSRSLRAASDLLIFYGGTAGFNFTDSTNSTVLASINNTGAACFASTITGTTIYGSTAVCSPVGLFSGCVGIGTSTPSAKLDVYAGADATSNLVLWGQTIRNEGNGSATNYGVGLKLKISSDGEPYKWAGIAAVAGTGYSNRTDLALYTAATSTANATEKVRITGAGYIGIGTCTPAYSLSVVSGWIHNYGAQNASGFRYENDAAGHVLNLNANNSYAQLYTSTDTSLYFGTNNDIRLKILNTGETCFKCNAYFCGSTYGIMGFGDKVMDKICYITTTTGTLCVPLDGLTYSSSFPTRAIYLYGTLLDNDAAHYAHMIYFYRNDYGGLQTCTISQSSLVHPSTAGQPFTFSVNDPGSTGKGACTLLLRFTSAGAGVAAGSYCTKMRIVVYNVPGL